MSGDLQFKVDSMAIWFTLRAFARKLLRPNRGRNTFLYLRFHVWPTVLKSPNDRFFEKLSMATFIYSQSFARNLLRGNRRRNTFRILFWCMAWGLNRGFRSNKSTHYLLNYGDFKNDPFQKENDYHMPLQAFGGTL